MFTIILFGQLYGDFKKEVSAENFLLGRGWRKAPIKKVKGMNRFRLPTRYPDPRFLLCCVEKKNQCKVLSRSLIPIDTKK